MTGPWPQAVTASLTLNGERGSGRVGALWHRSLYTGLCRWLSGSESHCRATSPSEYIGGSYSPPNIIARMEGRGRDTGPKHRPGFPLNYVGPGSGSPLRGCTMQCEEKRAQRRLKQAQDLDRKTQEGEVMSTLAGLPRHMGQCGPPRLSGVR